MTARLWRQRDRTPLPFMQGTAFAYINLCYEAEGFTRRLAGNN